MCVLHVPFYVGYSWGKYQIPLFCMTVRHYLILIFIFFGAQTIKSASDYQKKSGSGDRLCHTFRVTMVL